MVRVWRRRIVLLGLILGAGLAVFGQPTDAARVLLIDETKTFLSTMRVAALVGALRGTGLVAVDVRLADVESGFDDPLSGVEPPSDLVPYTISIVVTRGVDTGVFPYVWILNGTVEELDPQDRGALAAVTQIVAQVFFGIGTPLGVYDDLYPALLWASYVNEGWMV
jgi:hypothetical protein